MFSLFCFRYSYIFAGKNSYKNRYFEVSSCINIANEASFSNKAIKGAKEIIHYNIVDSILAQGQSVALKLSDIKFKSLAECNF